MIDFTVECVPPKSTSQQVTILKGKGGKLFVGKASKGKAAEARDDLLSLLKGHQPSDALGGPLSLTIEATWPWLSGATKKDKAKGRIPMTARPDADNFAKMVQDCLVKLLYIENDANVCELTVRKFWGDKPGIRVRLEPLEVL